MVINKNNIDRLQRNSRLASLVDNSYLTDDSNDNFQYIAKKFYPYEPLDKIKTLNTGTGMFDRVASIKAAYVNQPQYDISIDIEEVTKDIETLGFGCLGLGYKGREPYAYRLPSDGYFRQDDVHNIARTYTYTDENDMTYYYVYIQKFYDTYTENRLYKSLTKNILDYECLTEVDLKTIPETAKKQSRESHVFGRPAMFLILEDEADPYPVNSAIEKIKDHVYSMDRKKVMFDVEFLKNVDSFVLFRDIRFNGQVAEKRQKGLQLEDRDFGRYIDAGEKGGVEFVNNNNALIKDAMEQSDKDIRALSAMTSIPIDYLGLDSSHGIGAGSRSMIHGSFIKEISRIRHIRDRYLPEVIEVLMSVNSDLEETYSRPEIFAKDDKELLEEVVSAKNNDLLSHVRALMNYNDFTREEAEEEMLAILEEKKQMMLVATQTKSLLSGDDESQNTPSNAPSEGGAQEIQTEQL